MRGVNQHKSGNLVPYRVELISRIGQEAVDEIESNHNRHRWTIEECKAIKGKVPTETQRPAEIAEVRPHDVLE